MRCMACDGEMLLVSVQPDESMIIVGFERYTLQCLSCNEIEQRTVFTRPAEAPPATTGTRNGRAAAVVAVEPKALPMASGEAQANDIYLAFNTALEKVAKQLRRRKTELRE